MKSMIFKSSDSVALFPEESERISKSPANAVFSALGACLAGADSLALLTLSELTELEEILFALALAGAHGGLLVAACLENEAEEERLIAFTEKVKLALLCPPAGGEADYINRGFELSRKTQTVFLIRLRKCRQIGGLNEFEPLRYRKQPERFVLEPENAAARKEKLISGFEALANALRESGLSHRIYETADLLYSPKGRTDICAGCPYRGVFFILSKNWLRAFSDSGCTALGSKAPLLALDTALCPGSSPALLRGFLLASEAKAGRETVALIDPVGLEKGGRQGVEELDDDGLNAVVIILDNTTRIFDFEKALGDIPCAVKDSFDSFDLAEIENELKSALKSDGLKLLHCKGPCIFKKPYDGMPPFATDKNRCKGCKACGRLGCPAISAERRPDIDPGLCASCGLCEKVCQVGAIYRT